MLIYCESCDSSKVKLNYIIAKIGKEKVKIFANGEEGSRIKKTSFLGDENIFTANFECLSCFFKFEYSFLQWNKNYHLILPYMKESNTSELYYLYIIKTIDNKFIKIGISKEPNSRLKQLSTGSPVSLKILAISSFKNKFTAKVIESHLHEKFSSSRTNGEWFYYDKNVHNYLIKNLDGLDLRRHDEMV